MMTTGRSSELMHRLHRVSLLLLKQLQHQHQQDLEQNKYLLASFFIHFFRNRVNESKMNGAKDMKMKYMRTFEWFRMDNMNKYIGQFLIQWF